MKQRFVSTLIATAFACACSDGKGGGEVAASFAAAPGVVSHSTSGEPGTRGRDSGVRLSVQNVPPQAAPPPDLNAWLAGATSGALLLRTGASASLEPGPALATDVAIHITGLLARVKVSQRFANPGDAWAEGLYVFPLPDDAAVDRLRIDTGARIIEGVVREKAEARRTYEQAKSEGRRASLVEQERPNVFTTSVANIPPAGEITVEIEYQQSVRLDAGAYSLRFPTVVAPRFVPGEPLSETTTGVGWAADTNRVPDWPRITPPVLRPDAGPSNPVRIEIDLAPGFAVDGIGSPYHAIDVEERDGRYAVSLADGPVPADRDFVLEWMPRPGDAPQTALFTEVLGDTEYALVLVTPPHHPGIPPAPPPREVVFVIDTSGSMAGASLQQAQIALGHALSRLRPKDRFNILQFSDVAQALYPQSVAATFANVKQALDHVDGLVAEGGTQILPAIRLALAGRASGRGELRQVVFLTDGSVGNESELFEEIRAHLGDTRLFTVGIGSAPNSHFMRKAAEHGRGTFTHIGNPAEVVAKMGALFAKLEAVVLSDIELELPDGADGESIPARISDLYLGEPVMFALALGAPLENLRVRGMRGNQPWEVTLDRQHAEVRRGVHVHWARRKIEALLDARLGENDENVLHELREEVVTLALEHHLVSRYTSLVAVDVTPERRGYETLATHALAANLPAGWQAGDVFGMAQGATPAGREILLGVLLMAAGVATRRAHTRARF